jgi:hypothetical protein
MNLRFQVIEVGWETDWDANRHPRIRIGRRNWSAVLYDHPAEGGQVIALDVAHSKGRGARIETQDGATAASHFVELVGGEIDLSALNAIVKDLYELGRQGATKRWIGKTLTLKVHSTKGEQ